MILNLIQMVFMTEVPSYLLNITFLHGACSLFWATKYPTKGLCFPPSLAAGGPAVGRAS